MNVFTPTNEQNPINTTKRTQEQVDIFQLLQAKKAQLAVVGLGYVGLPVALEFARHFSVVGFDVSERKVNMMKDHVDPSGEVTSFEFENKDISYHHQEEAMKDARFYIVAVPTPIDEFKQPNLDALKSATKSVGNVLKRGDYVVFESTVYPGCTEEICVPILEKKSGLKLNSDFKVGYSPERINPGDKNNTIDKIVKIVSGSDEEALEMITKTYARIITAGVHQAPTIKVAEAAKIVENTQRDINIALMNELSLIFEKMDINTYDVLKAAGTKWNFLNFFPGLVGGHCIGVDPYYLIQKSIRVGHNPILVSAGRSVNDSMPARIAEKIIREFKLLDKNPANCKILLQGISFKENVTDIRNSKAADLVLELMKFDCKVDVVDPEASPKEVRQQYGFELTPQTSKDYDAIIVAVSHDIYAHCTEYDYQNMTKPDAFVFDIKGIMKGKINNMPYFSL